jgi:hypothetical protein
MTVFVAMSRRSDPRFRPAIEALYPGKFYHWNSNTSFVSVKGSAKSVADSIEGNFADLEEKRPEKPTGHIVVLAVTSSYWGWTDTALWEWIAVEQQQS